jgi:hypothetical protein
MRVTEKSGRAVAKHLVGEVLFPIAALAYREITAFTLITFPTDYREWDNDPIALLYVTVDSGPYLDDLAHHFMAHNVARQHCRNEIVKQVQV